MLSRWKHSNKLSMLRGAWRQGPGQVARQLWLIGADGLWRRRHMVFRQGADALAARNHPAPAGLKMREISALTQLSEMSRARLAKSDVASKWGAESWFDLGWRLWVAEEDGLLAALAWWRGAAESADFFVPLEQGQELLWHIFVLPEYRGRGLQRILWVALAQNRTRDGITDFLTNCRDYNIPSRRNIEKSGFVLIGACDENRYTGHRIWHLAQAEERR